MKNEHINAICRQLGVSLATISRYNSEHEDEIKHMGDIFYLRGDSKEKVLALLYMLSLGEDDDAVKRYRKETGLNSTEHDSANLLDQYKVPLLTAMVYNRAFYAMALNYQGFVNAGLAIGEVKEDSNENITPFPIRHKFFPRASRKVIAASAAAGFVLVIFFAVLFRFFYSGLGHQVNYTWVESLIEPKKASDGIAYVSMEDTDIRIGLSPPFNFEATAKGAKDETGNTKATVNYYTKTIRADKKNADLYINRGIAYTLDGYLEAAVKDFNKAIKLDPKNISAYYNRAIANAGMDAEISTIVADLKTVISINPGDKDAYYALGVLYSHQYKKEKTSNLLELAIDAFGHIIGYKDVDNILGYLNTLYYMDD